MDFSPGAIVKTKDGKLGTILEAVGPGRGYSQFTYPSPTSRGNHGVTAYPVLMEQGGEVRYFTADGFAND